MAETETAQETEETSKPQEEKEIQMKPETEAEKVKAAAALVEENKALKLALQEKDDHVAELKGALEEKGVKVRKSPRLDTKEGLEREIRRYVKKTVGKNGTGYRRGLPKEKKILCGSLLRRWKKITGQERKPSHGWDTSIILSGIDNPTVNSMYADKGGG